MVKKQLIAGTVSVAVIGILSYLGYKVLKEVNALDFDDFMGENISDEYFYRIPSDHERP